MVILGAGGFAKELIDIFVRNIKYKNEKFYFFDEIDKTKNSLFGFKVLHTIEEVVNVFKQNSNRFSLGIGTPKARYNLSNKFEQIGGELTTIVSIESIIGEFNVDIGKGACIMSKSIISNNVTIGKGTLINVDVLVGHDVVIGDFSDISPGVKITGHCEIGKYVMIGTAAVILPKVKIGSNSFIAAGTVIANDVPENSVVVGIVPSRVVKKLPEFEEE
jgi:sugar O-acyltransferase (sialic acid O-acetyltransferase NeuD family)